MGAGYFLEGCELKGTPTQELVEAIHTCIGWSACNAQLFEDTLAKFTALAFDVEPETAYEKALEVLAKLRSKPLGPLLTEVGRRTALPPDFELRLKTFKDERNWLIHKSYADVFPVIFRGADPRGLIHRIVNVGCEAGDLTRLIWEPTAAMANAYEFLRQNPEATTKVREILAQYELQCNRISSGRAVYRTSTERNVAQQEY